MRRPAATAQEHGRCGLAAMGEPPFGRPLTITQLLAEGLHANWAVVDHVWEDPGNRPVRIVILATVSCASLSNCSGANALRWIVWSR